MDTKVNKVGLGKKFVSMANAIIHGTRPKKYTCRFMAPGLTNYPGGKGENETWFISRDTMNEMQNSFIGCPVVAENKHEGSTVPDDFDDRVKKGDYDGVVTGVQTGADGWDYADFIVWDNAVQEQIEGKGYNVSCAFNTLDALPGGVMNAIPYDNEVKVGEYIHLAIVRAPRQTGARILLNSLDTENLRAILFSMNGKDYKIKLNQVADAADIVDEFNAKVRQGQFIKGDVDDLIGFMDKEYPSAAQWVKNEAIRQIEREGKKTNGWQDGKDPTINWDKIKTEVKGLIDKWKGQKTHQTLNWRIVDKVGYDNKIFKGENISQLKDIVEKMIKEEGGEIFANSFDTRESIEEEIETAKEIAKSYPSVENQDYIKQLEKELANWPKKNKGGSQMENCSKCGKLMSECNCSKANSIKIDPETAVIETPTGSIPLKEMVNAYEEKVAKRNADDEDEKKKKEEEDEKNSAGKINMDSEFNGVKISAMYDAYVEKKNAADEDEKKKKEDEDKKNAADEDEKKKKEEDEKKNAADEDEKKKKEEEEAVKKNHFNSLANAKKEFQDKGGDDKAARISKSDRIKIARDSKQY